MIDKIIIIIAPHLTLPAQKGADILIFNRAKTFIDNFISIHMLSTNHHYVYKNGKLIKKYEFYNKPRSKKVAAVRSLILKNNYLSEKFLTNEYSNYLKVLINNSKFDVVYFSFIYSAYNFKKYFDNNRIIKLIETHNNDITWYKNLSNFSDNMLSKFLAKISLKNTIKMIRELNHGFYFITLTPKDTEEYKNYIPNNNLVLIPPGIAPTKNGYIKTPQSNNEINLIFVGSLDVTMNIKALEFFAKDFYPKIIEKYNDKIKVRIVGRNPSKKIISLCKQNNWNLYKNVNQDKLEELISTAHFSILPFPYSTGFKMKLLESISLGVPFLSTSALKNQIKIETSIPFGIYSDDPYAWIQFIENNYSKTFDSNFRKDLIRLAKKFDWKIVNKKLIDLVNSSLEAKNDL